MSRAALEHMAAAARLAVRGEGGAEPNPLVGCVIVSPAGDVVGWGFHRRCGGPHAEVEALRRAGAAAAGATVYVTLEPCSHTGRTGPCTEALIAARVARVVYARPEPAASAGGGAARLREAGIAAERCDRCAAAVAVGAPYARRVTLGLPWIVAKWAQTVDGRVATRAGASRWISNPASRAIVHRKRGRVDAILTGIGTVRADDPMLTARCRRPRRVARRVVIDPDLELPPSSALVATAREAPVTVVCGADRCASAGVLEARGVGVLGIPRSGREIDLTAALAALVERHETTTVLVEAGPGLLGRLFATRLVNEAWVFVAPALFGDAESIPCVSGLTVETLTDGVTLDLWNVRRRGGDVLLRYGVG